jgi:hypothetical protein
MTGQRIVSIDFWRGLALLTIFIDHIPGNVLDKITYRNFGFSDAAEVFVFLAGTSCALAYLARFDAARAARQTIKILLRAFTLYTSHLAVLLAVGAVVAYAVLSTGDSRFLAALHFDVLTGDPLHALLGLVTLGYQPAYLNILPLYVVLLAMAPVVIMLARIRLVYAAAASGALYLATELLGLNLPVYPGNGGWFFNPLAWQFLFTLGLCLGAGIVEGRRAPHRPVLTALALGYVVLAAVWVQLGIWAPWDLRPVPTFIWGFDKTNLSLPRLLHVVALAYLVLQLPIERYLRLSTLAKPLIVLGRHSLPVFCIGTVLAIAAQIGRATFGHSPASDLVMLGMGAFIQVGLAWGLEWYGAAAKTRDTQAAALPAQPRPVLSR